jgi:hypothetical protein
MRLLVVIGIVLLGTLPVHAQHLSVIAVSHNIGEYDYSYAMPGTSSCNIYSTAVQPRIAVSNRSYLKPKHNPQEK